MRTIIAGSRSITDYKAVKSAIESCGWKPSVVLSGCANGVDILGEKWAKENGIPVESYPADWKLFGRSAGKVRNSVMATKAEALVAVWDGRSPGTEHMIEVAGTNGLTVFVYRVPFHPA